MNTERVELAPLVPGVDLQLTLHRSGERGSRPRVYIQAALHASEIPPMQPPAMIVFSRSPGDRVKPGDVVAVVVDPIAGTETPAGASVEGVLFARAARRFANGGQPLAKVPRRTGKLLTA